MDLTQVYSFFSDIDREYVEAMALEEQGPPEIVVQNILNELLDHGDAYPREAEAEKRRASQKKAQDLEDQQQRTAERESLLQLQREQSGETAREKEVREKEAQKKEALHAHYYTDIHRAVSETYRNEALLILQNRFPDVSVQHIRSFFNGNQHHLAPTLKQLTDGAPRLKVIRRLKAVEILVSDPETQTLAEPTKK